MKNKVNFLNLDKFIIQILIFAIFYSTILFGFFFDEDPLGGARHDFFYHYKISELFNLDFFQTFDDFGKPNSNDMHTRNSPFFWIIISFLISFFSESGIRLLNSLVSILIAISLYKCLAIKFKDTNKLTLILLSSIIFLSPTVRSLSIWPYSLIWGLLFFTISLYFFLKIQDTKNQNLKFKHSFLHLFFLILSSYIYPSFGIFIIYFGYYLFLYFKFSKKLFFLLIYCIFLSIPFLYYVITKNIFVAFYAAEGIHVDLSQSLNLSNKIMIIFTMILYFTLPIINFKKILSNFKKINIHSLIIILIFTAINIHFFNFPYHEGGAFGGGFFHKLSNLLFDNNFVFYIFFLISLFYLRLLLDQNWNNFLLLILLVLFNPQFTIYHKYYDPLIIILFLTLFQFNLKEQFFKKKYKFLQLFSILGFYLSLALYKSHLYSI